MSYMYEVLGIKENFLSKDVLGTTDNMLEALKIYDRFVNKTNNYSEIEIKPLIVREEEK